MENNTALKNISNELDRIGQKINGLQSSGNKISQKGLALVEAQLKNVSSILELLEEAIVNIESVAVAEETIPVDVKEVVGISLENLTPEITEALKQPEPAPVAEKKAKSAKEENPDNSLVAKMKRKPIKDLRSAIGINEKFEFIELLDGDATAWTNALRKLKFFSSYWEAEAMLSEFNQKYKWKEEDETLQSLMDLVERRYM